MILARALILSSITVLMISSTAFAGDPEGVNGSSGDLDGVGGYRGDTDGITGLRGDGDGVAGLHGGTTLGIGAFTMTHDQLEEVMYLRALVNLLQWEALFSRGH